MLHVDIVSKTNQLIQGIETYLNGDKLNGLHQVLEASVKINERRRDMWKASNFRHYNNFRAFIMGIKWNTQLFGEGVLYEGSENTELRQYRGQTGAQDDTIPTLDIFSGVIKYYPDNDLTRYLLDLRQYRPVVFQEFFKDLEHFTIDFRTLNIEELIVLYQILEQIYLFRNGHWQFVQNYILKNTKYATATGGTPITTWIPNQIGAVLTYMGDVLDLIGESDQEFYKHNSELLLQKREILRNQQEELLNPDFCASKVYDMGGKLNESDLNEHK
jgi:indoleamine 2,3-dioxygenase